MTKKSLKQIEKITGVTLTLGRLIWAIRMSAGYTQVAFAEILGVSRQHLCDIENDRKAISPKLAREYAKKLHCSLGEPCSEEQFIRLSLQGIVDRAGLNFTVEVKKKGRKRNHGLAHGLAFSH